jgi:hypothetical protein
MGVMVKGLIVAIVAAVAFIVYALVDCLVAEKFRFKVFNKGAWALIIIVLPVIGAILWFILGRRSQVPSSRRPMMAPDDDPDFLKSRPGSARHDTDYLDRETTNERIRRLERELAEHDDDNPSGKGK